MRMDGWMDGWMDRGWMDACMDGKDGEMDRASDRKKKKTLTGHSTVETWYCV